MTGRLDAAVEAGKIAGKLALYFGCWNKPGHYLHNPRGRVIWDDGLDLQLPWAPSLMDGRLLKNGEHRDVYDGKVFWTCGGLALWYAFFWWDRSVDRRSNSNSGFYVRGFGWPEAKSAFDFACAAFPTVVSRQSNPLVLQEKP